MNPEGYLGRDKPFMDKRLTGMCVYCGGQDDTDDHVPSKTLLEEPLPAHVPVVRACAACNAGFSLDEQYLSCFLECVLCGTTDPSGIQRASIRRTLAGSPPLAARIAASQTTDESGDLIWQPEVDRIRRVVLKLARGHAAYELYPQLEDPDEVAFVPFLVMSDDERSAFEEVNSGPLQPWPELGSRAFLRACGVYPDSEQAGPLLQAGSWIIVQPGRYRYSVIETGGVLVRIVLSEYLACAVTWE